MPLAHPFRFGPDGAAVTVDADSDAATIQGVVALATTRRGERSLRPGFGTTDPAFDEVDVVELNLALDEYGPDVQVELVDSQPIDDRTVAVTLRIIDPEDSE